MLQCFAVLLLLIHHLTILLQINDLVYNANYWTFSVANLILQTFITYLTLPTFDVC